MSQPYKICPRCGTGAELHAPQCAACGHFYQTQFPPANPPAMGGGAYPPPPAGYPPHGAYPPPQYGPPQYGPPQYGPPQYPPVGYYAARPDDIQGYPGGHNPWASALLTLVFVGLGQIMNKQTIKGIVVLLASMMLCLVTFGLAILVVYPVAMIDAYSIASRLNRGEVVGQWQWF